LLFAVLSLVRPLEWRAGFTRVGEAWEVGEVDWPDGAREKEAEGRAIMLLSRRSMVGPGLDKGDGGGAG